MLLWLWMRPRTHSYLDELSEHCVPLSWGSKVVGRESFTDFLLIIAVGFSQEAQEVPSRVREWS